MSEQQDAPKTEEPKVKSHPEPKAITPFERLIVQGDLSSLTPDQRVQYYRYVCRSLGINYLTRPFEYIQLNGKLTLYARRDATDQLRTIHGIAITIVSRERFDDVYAVTARASTPDGRTDEALGAISTVGLRGTDLANAMMKAETKAKRRVTLSIVGLGWSDETEIETMIGGPPKKPIQAITAQRKFSDLSDDEKRSQLLDMWNAALKKLEGKLPDGFGTAGNAPDFAAGDQGFLLMVVKLIRDAAKLEDAGKILEIITQINEAIPKQDAKEKSDG